jgi:hypothetical protein
MSINFHGELSWRGAENRCEELCDYLENNDDLEATFSHGCEILERGKESGRIQLLSGLWESQAFGDIEKVFDNFSDLSFFISYFDDEAYGYKIIVNGEVDDEERYGLPDGWHDCDEVAIDKVNDYLDGLKDWWRYSWRHIPESLKTQEKCMLCMVKSDDFWDYNEDYIPEEFWQDEDFCVFAAVSQGKMPDEVPKQFQDACKKALKEGNNAFKYLPQSVQERYAGVFLSLVENDSSAMKKVPESFVTTDFYLAAVKRNGSALQYVPESLKTAELCLAAVKQYGAALGHVPEELKTPEPCLAAVEQSYFALQYVPEHLKTAELCLAAVEQDGFALRYVPEALREQVAQH